MAPSALRLITLLFSAPFSPSALAQEKHPRDTSTSTSFSAPIQMNCTDVAAIGKEGGNGLRIIDDDPFYKYVGCWSETAPMEPNLPALDGPYLTMPGLMRVEPCLEYCGFAKNRFDPEKKGYRYAGLEFAQECWCGDTLSDRSVRLEDSACNVPCDGANTTACGGHLAITLYARKPGAGDGDGGGDGDGNPGDGIPNPPGDEAALRVVGVGFLVLAVNFALAWNFL
ncbi:WSC domain-containing protein [Hypoxylon sp. NC0597]|nr:WSC domain-containing protein [Hypoxylon sp. NC0597]